LAKVLHSASLDQRIMPNARALDMNRHACANKNKPISFWVLCQHLRDGKVMPTFGIAAKCPVKHKPLQKGSFSFHSTEPVEFASRGARKFYERFTSNVASNEQNQCFTVAVGAQLTISNCLTRHKVYEMQSVDEGQTAP
jgi:hypothetical protein